MVVLPAARINEVTGYSVIMCGKVRMARVNRPPPTYLYGRIGKCSGAGQFSCRIFRHGWNPARQSRNQCSKEGRKTGRQEKKQRSGRRLRTGVPSGLKGRFCQPRPTAWVFGMARDPGPVRAVHNWLSPRNSSAADSMNDPFRVDGLVYREPRPSAWAVRTSLSGSKGSSHV